MLAMIHRKDWQNGAWRINEMDADPWYHPDPAIIPRLSWPGRIIIAAVSRL